jgi:hypothetical protein
VHSTVLSHTCCCSAGSRASARPSHRTQAHRSATPTVCRQVLLMQLADAARTLEASKAEEALLRSEVASLAPA